MPITWAEIEQSLNLLSATPTRLALASHGLEVSRLHARIDAKAWSANDILAHLRACTDVWGKSILAMAAEDHPTLRYMSPRTWIRKTNYLEQDFQVALQAFTEQRQALLDVLSALDVSAWSRGATCTGMTKGREQTIMSYAQRIITHEQEHLVQLEALLH